jgi:hypothetical protein
MPELALVVHRIEKRKAKFEEEYDYDVKRILYGSYPEKKIRLYDDSDYWYAYPRSEEMLGDDFVVTVAPSLFKEQTEYIALYHFPLSQERAETALCQARLDYATLSSASILIGKEVSLDWEDEKNDGKDRHPSNWPSTVEVMRVISGEPLKPGERIHVCDAGAIRFINYHRRAHQQPRIYFVSHAKSGAARPIYTVITHQPVDQELKVLEALKRRNDYPVLEVNDNGVTKKIREIIFRGTKSDVSELLNAQHKGVRMLAERTIMIRSETSNPDATE